MRVRVLYAQMYMHMCAGAVYVYMRLRVCMVQMPYVLTGVRICPCIHAFTVVRRSMV